MGWYDRKVRRVRDLSCGDTRIFLELEVRRVDCRNCGKVKRERLEFLADNPFYTKRFAYFVGRRCRQASIADVAKELALDWHTVKALEMQYMEAQLAHAGTPGPRVIGIDEIAIRKGHSYRIVVSDLLRGRPIWFGGKDRSEASLAQFYAWLGAKKSARVRLAVMDMWKPFRLATRAHAPKSAILFDKFHIMRHLGEALDTVRKWTCGQTQVRCPHAPNRSSSRRQRFKIGPNSPTRLHEEAFFVQSLQIGGRVTCNNPCIKEREQGGVAQYRHPVYVAPPGLIPCPPARYSLRERTCI